MCLTQGKISELEIPHCVRDDKGGGGGTCPGRGCGGYRAGSWGGGCRVAERPPTDDASGRSRLSVVRVALPRSLWGGGWGAGGRGGAWLRARSRSWRSLTAFGMTRGRSGGLPWAAPRLSRGGSVRRRLAQGEISQLEIPHCVRDDKGEVGMTKGVRRRGHAVTGARRDGRTPRRWYSATRAPCDGATRCSGYADLLSSGLGAGRAASGSSGVLRRRGYNGGTGRAAGRRSRARAEGARQEAM